jgi:hypothetical protein
MRRWTDRAVERWRQTAALFPRGVPAFLICQWQGKTNANMYMNASSIVSFSDNGGALLVFSIKLMLHILYYLLKKLASFESIRTKNTETQYFFP